jgi:glycerol-1-phosphate dehydrogenase [NAD(P)+]
MNTRTTVAIVSGPRGLARIPDEFKKQWLEARAFIIADDNTWAAAGSRVASILGEAGIYALEPFVYPGTPAPHADEGRIAELSRILADKSSAGPVAPISVGSGSINDIVKRAAFENGLPYMCVPTAPSVDGYTSFGSAVTVNGFKTTLPCDAPRVVVADEDVMAGAPMRLLAAGYGDLAAKLMSGRDWLVAESLGLESINPGVWDLSQARLTERLAHPDGLSRRDPVAVKSIFDGLCDTGLAMQDQGDSRPASGAEHHISHCLEMRGLTVDGHEALHGEKVAAGTLLSALMGEFVFAHSADEIRRIASASRGTTRGECERAVRSVYEGTGIPEFAVQAAVKVSLEKLVEGDARDERLARIVAAWDGLRERAFVGRPRYAELADMFSRAGCLSFGRLGLDESLIRWAISAARTIRNRYTILDLASDLGLFELGLDSVVSSAK